jgi:hypothetical protein
MRLSLVRFGVCTLMLAIIVCHAPAAFCDLLLNYQFETVDGEAPLQTTPDSSGNFTSSNVAPLVNALTGFDTLTPGIDYPLQMAGSVANTTFQSLNPNNFMNFYSTVDGVNTSTRNNYSAVQIAADAAGPLNVTFTNFSVALWLKPTDLETDRWAIGKTGTGGNRGWQILGKSGTTDLELDYYATTENGSDRAFIVPNVLPLSTWTHVAFTFDGTAGTEALYINGVSQTLVNGGEMPTVPTTLNSANAYALDVGHRGRTGPTIGGWRGGIDDVRIYDQTLTAAEVQALLVQVTSGGPGDFNGDGSVDGADFAIWQSHFPAGSGENLANGDADGDGDVDGADFVIWQTHASFNAGSGVASVPEPQSIFLLTGALVLLGSCKVFGRKDCSHCRARENHISGVR